MIAPNDAHNRALIDAVHPPQWANPEPSGRYNLVVIGAGTAGLVTAAGAAGVGAKVALIERHMMGGDCLVVGCVPSKAVIAASRSAALVGDAGDRGFVTAMERMRQVRAHIAPVDGAARFRDLGIDVFFGDAEFIDGRKVRVGEAELDYARAVIATGARAFVPPIEGLGDAGYLTNDTVFELTERPRRLAVIGAGPIGCELSQALSRLGVRVTIIDRADRVLSQDEPDASAIVAEALERDGVRLLLSAAIERVEADRTVVVRDHSGDEVRVGSDHILVATGRRPNVDGLGLDRVGVKTDRGGVVVDRRLRTTNRRIYACGDVCSPHKFTHAADAMARIVIRNALFFGRQKHDELVIPRATYTSPEVASVGLSAASAADSGVHIDTYEQPLAEVDRALTDSFGAGCGEPSGFLRVHTARGTDRIVGATIVSPSAGELISEVALAMTHGLGLSNIDSTIHPYPTLSLGLRQVAGRYSRTRLTPRVARIMAWLLRWRRR